MTMGAQRGAFGGEAGGGEAGGSEARAGATCTDTCARGALIALVAGEESGDRLGAPLMRALRARAQYPLSFIGVGGAAMAAEGLASLCPLEELAVMGPLDILPRLPRLLRLIREVADAIVAARSDVLVIIDSPEFTHRVARRVRTRAPEIAIIDYVSPSVWAWRPGRARKMRHYVDHVMALLPFEPAAHARLGGPPCSYVGHPLIERLGWMRARDPGALAVRLGIPVGAPVLVVLPGSRSNELRHIGPIFGETLRRLAASEGVAPGLGGLHVIVPTVKRLAPAVEALVSAWPRPLHIVTDEEDKFAAFRLARAALAVSGTVTLELALVGTPMVVAYRSDPITGLARFLIRAPSVVLANLVLGENVFPEYLQPRCTAENLAQALARLLRDGPERDRQLAALGGFAERMAVAAESPSAAAADIVLAQLAKRPPPHGGPRARRSTSRRST